MYIKQQFSVCLHYFIPFVSSFVFPSENAETEGDRVCVCVLFFYDYFLCFVSISFTFHFYYYLRFSFRLILLLLFFFHLAGLVGVSVVVFFVVVSSHTHSTFFSKLAINTATASRLLVALSAFVHVVCILL